MILDLSEDAKEYGRQALRAFDAAGGDQLVQQAEAKPDTRDALVGPVLNELGAWELDPRTDADGLEAAAALCRSAGYWALPYPVAERLARPVDLDVDGLIVVADNRPSGIIGGLESRWAAVTLDGVRSTVVRRGVAGPAFVTALELSETDRNGAGDIALGLVLPCWTLLGMLDRAVELTVAHVSLRKQFGQTLSAFQGVQFQLTDAEVERSGLDILAKYALWSIATARPEALEDALALRMSAIEAAEVVFRVCHQLHGAVGFCDETTLSWLSRYSQPVRRLPLGLSATRDELTRRAGGRRPHGVVRVTADLDEFRATVRAWCDEHIPSDWRAAQTGVSDEEFVRFQKAWFAELHAAGFAVPHWPREWGGGMSVPEQIVLYQELAAHDAPRLVLAFVGIHHAASTLLAAGTDEQRRRHLPAILDGEIWVQGFSEPEAGSDLASLRTTARRDGDTFVVNGQKLWASGGMHADWCLLLARTDPDAPKRKGISYFLLDMATPGIEVRPIRNAVGDSHFCEIFLNDVRIPATNLVGAENSGWQVAQATLGAERGMTMLELAERLGNAGFRWLVQSSPTDDPVVADRLAQFETEITGLRGLCRQLVENNEAGIRGPSPTRPSSSCTTASCCSA